MGESRKLQKQYPTIVSFSLSFSFFFFHLCVVSNILSNLKLIKTSNILFYDPNRLSSIALVLESH